MDKVNARAADWLAAPPLRNTGQARAGEPYAKPVNHQTFLAQKYPAFLEGDTVLEVAAEYLRRYGVPVPQEDLFYVNGRVRAGVR